MPRKGARRDGVGFFEISSDIKFRITETLNLVEDIVSEVFPLKKTACILAAIDETKLMELKFSLNALHHNFKIKIYDRASFILKQFFQLMQLSGKGELAAKDLWFLRSLQSVLLFLIEHGDHLNSRLLRKESKNLDYLSLTIPKDSLLISSVDKDALKTLLKNVEAHIEKKREFPKEVNAAASISETIKKNPLAPSLEGIPNLGNSCYMNSNLQAVFGSSLQKLKYREIPPPDKPVKGIDETNGNFLQRFNRYLRIDLEDWKRAKKLQGALRSFRDVYGIAELKIRKEKITAAAKKLRKALFDSKLAPNLEEKNLFRQHDAPECMLPFLIALNNKFKLSVTTESLENKSLRTEEVNDAYILEVQIGKNEESFQNVIIEFASKEIVDDPENPWTKDGKVITKFSREIKIKGKLPETLVIQLKRMAFDNNYKKFKIDTDITWNSGTVDLAPLFDSTFSAKGESTTYTLEAYVNHHGTTPDHGHYTAHVKSDGGWLLLDDNDAVVVEKPSAEMQSRNKGYLFVLKKI